MNNRLIEFDLDPASPNVLGPGKRPVHTLNPYIAMEGGRPAMLGVSPGGVSQTTTCVPVEEDSLHEFYFGSAKAIRMRHDGTLEAAADLRRQACALAE